MNKKVLIIALNEHWSGISRLPSALFRAGFEVHALCPRSSYIAKTKYLKSSIQYPTFTYARSKIFYILLLLTLIYYKPDLVIQGDEEALVVLENIKRFCGWFPGLKFLAETIRKSLPEVEDSGLLLNKSKFMSLCQQHKLNVPQNLVLQNESDFNSALKTIKYPIVLKNDSGYGGSGVVICQSEEQLKIAFKKMTELNLFKALKAKIRDLLFINLSNGRSQMALQEFVKGQIGQVPFVAINGKIVAENSMFKERTFPNIIGPSTVVRGFSDSKLSEMVSEAIGLLRYNGFGAFEFMYNPETKEIKFIECNPRPTPTCHLDADHVTNDLAKALYAGINQLPFKPNNPKPFLVALFPNEKRRDPNSTYLKEGYHDIPKDDPNLLAYLDR